MRHIIISAILSAVTFAGTGCSGFLDEEMKSTLGPDNTYNSSYGFELAATGLYGWARSEFNTWGGATASQGQACPYEMFQIATDIVHQGQQMDGSLTPFEKLSYTPSTTFVVSYWNWGYGLISSANELLKYSEINTNWDNESDKLLYQATARFFRAYAYRYLVYLYGDVPFVEKIETDYRTDFTRTPKNEVLDKMIEDLIFAENNLPTDPDKVEPGKLTTWAAKHLLSEVYLMAGKYDDAKKKADEVINCGYFHLMQQNERFGEYKDMPGDVFYDMFAENNQNRTSGNMESIWVMQLEYKTDGGGGSSEDWTRRAWNPRYWDKLQGFVLADTLGGRGLAQIVPLSWWIEDNKDFYDEGDIRNSEYNIKRHWYYNDPQYPDLLGKEAPITESTREKNQIYPVITKFFYGKADDLQYTGSNKDRIKFRLAETYLLKAEACIQLNDYDGAKDAINEVRKRAGASEISSSQVTMDFLLDERIRELIGEELRRFTLARTGKWLERVKKYNSYSAHMDEHNLLLPIPQYIIDLNTGAEFPQNPGY
ncbi:MAG: RagB/SusD family nutrient uptake outer membrane protein [Phocaeicola sp.]|nr:RagB/SusD family nutrient uptake outer membrane protein [Phocaeicola sp.]